VAGVALLSITVQHTQEILCMCHIYALAGVAGVNYALKPAYDYGVDGCFTPVTVRGNERVQGGVSLDFQAKATINWTVAQDDIVYDLDARAYNNIVSRGPEDTTLILILLCLPGAPDAWHGASADETVLRHCCYWHIFSGEMTENSSTKRIRIPTKNPLTPTSLLTLMEMEKRRRKGLL
jgi:hypothetical protein